MGCGASKKYAVEEEPDSLDNLPEEQVKVIYEEAGIEPPVDEALRRSSDAAAPGYVEPTSPDKTSKCSHCGRSSVENDLDGVDSSLNLQLYGKGSWRDVLDRLEEFDEFMANSDSDVESELGKVAYSSRPPPAPPAPTSQPEAPPFSPLEDWELAAAWNELRSRRLPARDVAARLIQGISELYASEPSVVYLDRPAHDTRLVVVGDLHGHFGDLLHILDEYQDPHTGTGATHYLFNGDFVDRGAWGPEVLLCLYCMKLQHPTAVHLNRGNHEDHKQNILQSNGFRDRHCARAWPNHYESMYELCSWSFQQLPICHIIGKEIIVVHGGLPLDTGVTLEEIANIDRKREIPSQKCILVGYEVGQWVRAKKAFKGEAGHVIAEGTPGRLASRVGKTNHCIVYFQGDDGEVDAKVSIKGAPELERDVEICFEDEEACMQQRRDRIFTSLLWSDPAEPKAGKPVGPSSRGPGFYFDERVAEDFLQANGLRCLLRSHEKKDEGFREELRSDTKGLLTATVFSASNYPGGAGELDVGNKATVIIVTAPKEGEQLSIVAASPWREDYLEMLHWTEAHLSKGLSCELQELGKVRTGVCDRCRGLSQLKEKIYCHRPALLKFFNSIDTPAGSDKKASGTVSLSEWASAMRACIVPDKLFPWEWLAPHLAQWDADGKCHYATFLQRYGNALSRRLADRWEARALADIALTEDGSKNAAAEWEKLDTDKDGVLSYDELRLSARGITTDQATDDARAYTLIAHLDSNKNGFVDRDEFDQAMAKLEDIEPENCDSEDFMCWAAVQGVLRTLSTVRCRTANVFSALDKARDGRLDRREFTEGLKQILSGSVLLESLDKWEPALWPLVDDNGSGYVSPLELAAALAIVDTTLDASTKVDASTNAKDQEPGEAWKTDEAVQAKPPKADDADSQAKPAARDS